MPKNLYFILGITQKATSDEIKRAYRKLAKEFHPDNYPGRESAFRAVQKAYSVLSNPAKRQVYDQLVQHSKEIPLPSEDFYQGPFETAEPLIFEKSPAAESLFLKKSFHEQSSLQEELFDAMAEGLSGEYFFRRSEVSDIAFTAILSRNEARKGGYFQVLVPVRLRCSTCRGSGHIGLHECWHCGGEGGVAGDRSVLIHYPAGIEDGHLVEMDLAAYGYPGRNMRIQFRVERTRRSIATSGRNRWHVR